MSPSSNDIVASRPHVLLAEDNEVNQMVLRRLLERLGCQVDVANNGREAIDALKKGVYDLVFMDCQMPEVDGIEATKLIRSDVSPGGSDGTSTGRIPIVALTACAMVGDRERCLDSGMDDYLTKPVTRSQLQETLDRWIVPDGSS